MFAVIIALGTLTALAAAVRSTWSPCGVSMLSTITPFGERGRGHRYGATAAWFVVGAVLGGATLGAALAGLAVGAGAIGLGHHRPLAVGVVAVAALAAAGIDRGVFGDIIPLLRRQVDDRWLGRYRSWVYGAGFGWQIGVGLTTYIMTAAVLLVGVIAVVSASPIVAGALGVLFGLTRGLAVFLSRRASSPARLRELHRRIDEAREPVRRAVIAVELATSAIGAAAVAGFTAAAVTALVIGAAAGLAGLSWAVRRTVVLRFRRSG